MILGNFMIALVAWSPYLEFCIKYLKKNSKPKPIV